MDFYGFVGALFVLWLCCFCYFGLKIADSMYGVYFSIGYVLIEFILLIRQYVIHRRE